MPIKEHKAQYLTDVVVGFLESHQISISNCRGQSYDNAADIAGKYSGLQVRIKEICGFSIFVACAAYSLNLVGVQAVGSGYII